MRGNGKPEERGLDRKTEAGFLRYAERLGLVLPPGLALTPTVWPADGAVMILDQRRLPERMTVLACRSAEEVVWAIRRLAVRGAPAIGLAAAHAMALGAGEISRTASSGTEQKVRLGQLRRLILATRPTAANLPHAVDRLWALLPGSGDRGAFAELPAALEAEAVLIHVETVQQDLAMARQGLKLIGQSERILTHCHTGGVATGGLGTALGVIKAAHAAGRRIEVLCCETRPLFQGARLTAWELARERVPFSLITDSMAAHFIGRGEVDRVLVGADRVAMNGDTANKIGTRGLVLLARHAGIPAHVVAPTTTLDPNLATGNGIVIEERDGDEVRQAGGRGICPPGTAVRNPAFDITPGRSITSFVTERGTAVPPLDHLFSRLESDK
jgi:methylthioribose-1-phosphate isomerase